LRISSPVSSEVFCTLQPAREKPALDTLQQGAQNLLVPAISLESAGRFLRRSFPGRSESGTRSSQIDFQSYLTQLASRGIPHPHLTSSTQRSAERLRSFGLSIAKARGGLQMGRWEPLNRIASVPRKNRQLPRSPSPQLLCLQ